MKMSACPRGSKRRFDLTGSDQICQRLRTSDMRSIGGHKDQPQAPTSTLVLVFMISLLKPRSTSAIYFDNTSFNFPSFVSDSLNLLDIQGNASVLSQYPYLALAPSLPNQVLNGTDGGRATYTSKVHLWDVATGNEADFAARFSFRIDCNLGNFCGCQQRHFCGDGLAFFVAPWGLSLTSGLGGGHLSLPNGSFVAVEVDTYQNSWDPDVPHIGINLNNVSSMATVTVPWLKDKILNGGLVNISIMYDSYASNLSVVLMDADGGSDGGPVSLYYAPFSLSEYVPEWVEVGFSAAIGVGYEFHTVQSWEFSSSLQVASLEAPSSQPTSSQPEEKKAANSWSKWLLIGMGGVVGSVVIMVTSRVAWVRYRLKAALPDSSNDMPDGNDAPKSTKENITDTKRGGEGGDRSTISTKKLQKSGGPKMFSYEELSTATDSFADGRIMGKGGSGIVYEGHIGDTRTKVAVMIIDSGSHQGIKEYKSEVTSISQLRHKNLVQLIGYCHEANKFALVYEFMREGSLEDHLFKGGTLLTWERRYNIARGLASALHYLHKLCNPCVIHGDITSSNTMLDERFETKLGEIGLVKLVDHTRGPKAIAITGTPGYTAPEYLEIGKASKESDVYSFGVVLLEVVSGRRVIDPARADQAQKGLVEFVWTQYGRGKLLDAVDSRLGGNFDEKQAKATMIAGLWCAHPVAASRPSIEAAMAVLNSKARNPILPSKMPPVPTSDSAEGLV